MTESDVQTLQASLKITAGHPAEYGPADRGLILPISDADVARTFDFYAETPGDFRDLANLLSGPSQDRSFFLRVEDFVSQKHDEEASSTRGLGVSA